MSTHLTIKNENRPNPRTATPEKKGMGMYQCWSESGLVSPAVSPSPQDQSPSTSPLDQSPRPVGQSPSPSPRVQQKSE